MAKWLFLALACGPSYGFAAQSNTPPSAGKPAEPALVIGSLLAKGDVGISTMKRHSLTGGQVLASNKTISVYSGVRDPVFQIVLWGKDQEKPDKVLIEFEPKKQSLEGLRAFNADWSAHFKAGESKPASLDAFVKDTAAHLKTFCAKLPPGARCEVLIWENSSSRVLRADIHLKEGPSVPKAIEFDRRVSDSAPKSAGSR